MRRPENKVTLIDCFHVHRWAGNRLHASEPINQLRFKSKMPISICRVPRPSSDKYLVGSRRATRSCDRTEITWRNNICSHKTNIFHAAMQGDAHRHSGSPFLVRILSKGTSGTTPQPHNLVDAVMKNIGIPVDGEPRVCGSLHNVGARAKQQRIRADHVRMCPRLQHQVGCPRYPNPLSCLQP